MNQEANVASPQVAPAAPADFERAAAAFHAFFDELRGHYLERDRLFQQIELALLCREHVLVVGPPGTAKSELAASVLQRIVDERTQAPSVFAKQIAETTVQTDLIGPVDFKVLTETGRTEHLTEDGMLGAVHGFLDEVFDGRDMLLRSLLNVLHERELKSGTKVVAGRIECAIMTSNRYLSEVLQRSPELLLAFSDRVAFICFVPKGFARRENRARMLDRVAGRQRISFQQRLTIQDLDVLQEAAEAVEVPGVVLDAVERLTENLEQKLAARAQEDPAFVPTKYLSSRTLVKAVKVLRAAVVLDAIAVPRPTPLRVTLADLPMLESFLALGGPLSADRAALLAAAVDPRERVQLEAADAEAWAFAESLAEALAEVEGGDAREAKALDVKTEARNAEELARKFQPDAVAASAASIGKKLATPPRHGKNADALAAALHLLSEATAQDLASRIPDSRRLVQTLKAAGAIAEAGRFVAAVAVSRKALAEAAVGAVAVHLAALADREEAREFEPGGALDLSSLGKEALALLRGINALQEETTSLLGAHELLLRVGSLGTGSERDRVRHLRAEVSRARAELPPEEPQRKGSSSRARGDPVRSVLAAWKRGDANEAYARLSGLYLEGVRARDPEVAGAARRALHAFEGKVKRGIADAVARDPLRCFLAQVGDGALAAEAARLCGTLPGHLHGRVEDETTEALAALAFDLASEKWAVFDLAVGASRFFDVEGATSEDVEIAPARARAGKLLRTPYPTENMVVEIARGVEEVRDFLITDPRLLKYDVAAGRQLVRAYLAEAPPEKPKKVRRTAVRVYLCDASGSMRGPRARFRDAILIAELNNLSVKAQRGAIDPLYFTFFNDFVGPLSRVATAGDAVREVRSLFETSPASGGTALTSALVTAFESIREARGSDPDLARATVVLITDGEAEIGLEEIRAANAPVGGLEVVLSFISLGEENRHLKALVLAQQEEGQRAFYCHLSDAELAGVRSDFDCGPRLLLPRRAEVEVDPKDPEIQEALAALEAIGKRRPRSSAAAPGLRFEGIFNLAAARRGASLQPEPSAHVVALVGDLLEAVCEAAALCPAERRAGEAVALLEHLLSVYDITVPQYLAAVAQLPESGRKALQRIRLLAGPGTRREDIRAVRTGERR